MLPYLTALFVLFWQWNGVSACVLRATTTKGCQLFRGKKCIRVTWLEDFLTSKWPGSFTALAPPLDIWPLTLDIKLMPVRWVCADQLNVWKLRCRLGHVQCVVRVLCRLLRLLMPVVMVVMMMMIIMTMLQSTYDTFHFSWILLYLKTYYWVMVGRIARRGGSGKCWRLKKYFV